MVSGPAASASPGNVLEMQIIGPFSTSIESETRGWELEMYFNKTSQCKRVQKCVHMISMKGDRGRYGLRKVVLSLVGVSGNH